MRLMLVFLFVSVFVSANTPPSHVTSQLVKGKEGKIWRTRRSLVPFTSHAIASLVSSRLCGMEYDSLPRPRKIDNVPVSVGKSPCGDSQLQRRECDARDTADTRLRQPWPLSLVFHSPVCSGGRGR